MEILFMSFEILIFFINMVIIPMALKEGQTQWQMFGYTSQRNIIIFFMGGPIANNVDT